LSITKIRTYKSEKDVNYATTQDLIEQLHVFEKQMGWSIFEILGILKKRKADSLSIIKEKPFHYFYARLSEKIIIIRVQTSEQETEFRIPLEQLV
jgi:hypothetical protein